MMVPTVLATTARRSYLLCSTSESALEAIWAVVIKFPPFEIAAGLVGRHLSGPDLVVFLRDVFVGVVGQQRCRDDPDDGAAQDIKRYRKARTKGGQQRRCDKRRGAARDDRGELVAERAAAVAQPGGEAFRYQRCLGAVHRHDRQPRQRDGDEDQCRNSAVEHGKIDEAKDRDEQTADNVHLLAADAVGQMPGDRDPKKTKDGIDEYGRQQKIPRL